MRHLWAILGIAVTFGAMAETPNDRELRSCLTAAMTDYAKAKVAFFASKGGDVSKGTMPSLTIDYFMTKRRLEEAYCAEYVRCVVAFNKPPDNLAGMVAGTQFASCLADEAAEQDEK
jgi:hypothetical protein